MQSAAMGTLGLHHGCHTRLTAVRARAQKAGGSGGTSDWLSQRQSERQDAPTGRDSGRGSRTSGSSHGRGRGRGGGSGGRRSDSAAQFDRRSQPPPSSPSLRASASSRMAPAADFVVIGRADGAGGYIAPPAELEAAAGGRFWEAALMDDDDDDEDYDEDEDLSDGDDDELLDDGDDDEDEDIDAEDVSALLRELAEDLEEAEGEEGEEGGEQQSSAGGGAAAAAWRRVYLGAELPQLQLGSVELKAAPGRGRGVFATAPVEPGSVLMVAAPLSLLYCETGSTPEIEELAVHLSSAVSASNVARPSAAGAASAAALEPWQRAALLQLRAGAEGGDSSSSSGGGGSSSRGELQLPELQSLLGADGADGSSGTSSSSSSSSASGNQELPGPEQVQRIVFANCTGEESEDAALTLLRGSASAGHLGVWPAAAMINHSCSPNAHTLLLGDRLVVRAAAPIAAGEQVFLSYLGPGLFAPAAARAAELREQWSFDCGCARCKAEARYASTTLPEAAVLPGGSSSAAATAAAAADDAAPRTLAELLLRVHSLCEDRAPELDAAVDAGDTAALSALASELRDMQSAVETALRAARPPAHVRRWLQGSVFALYDLLSLCAHQLPQAPPPQRRGAGGGGRGRGGGRGGGRKSASAGAGGGVAVDTESLATCARIVAGVAPGSAAHVDLAIELLVRCEARFGDEHQECVDALRAATAAHVSRYGPLSRGMLQLLMDTRAGAALL